MENRNWELKMKKRMQVHPLPKSCRCTFARFNYRSATVRWVYRVAIAMFKIRVFLVSMLKSEVQLCKTSPVHFTTDTITPPQPESALSQSRSSAQPLPVQLLLHGKGAPTLRSYDLSVLCTLLCQQVICHTVTRHTFGAQARVFE